MTDDAAEQPYEGTFHGAEHRFAVRIYYEDTDAGGVVYHANYLRFMERARTDMLRVAGIDQRSALQGGIGVYVVAEINIKYLRPAIFDDALVVRSRIARVGASSCTITQRITRGEELLSDATVAAVFVGPDGRPRRQPPAWVAAFQPFVSETA